MFDLISQDPQQLIILVNSVALVAALVIIFRTKSAMANLKHELFDQNADYSRQSEKLKMAERSMVSMGKRLMQLEKRLNISDERSQELYEREIHRDESAVSYKQANRMVQRGVGVEDIVKSCGISRSEAQLLKVLSRNNH